ncbi:probable insulin-like peptide 5 [Drosophila eugracilis]|uniref:probable insulin-like peptide 5 n=1 Tax=Drosophila eugracilis TaxID=29029 RepID=UPI0007E5D81A|nr:probable insulin-like peptide 5 [Drosophila eugracilis]
MMFRTVLPLLLILIPLLKSAEGVNRIQVCGPALLDLVEMMCPQGFNGMFQKRDSLGLFDYVDNLGNEDNSDMDTKSHSSRLNSLTGMRRDFRGIVDDCCRKPCSTSTMKSYCRQ